MNKFCVTLSSFNLVSNKDQPKQNLYDLKNSNVYKKPKQSKNRLIIFSRLLNDFRDRNPYDMSL